jgi:MFS family permease
MVAGAQGSGYALGIWMPTYLRTVRHLSAPSTGGFLLVQIFGALIGFLIGTWLSDAIGRKWTFLTSAVLSLVMVLVYMYAPIGNEALLFLGIPLNIVLLMKFPPMGPFMTELYPTEMRGTGQGFCYNSGRAIGSFFPTMIGFLAEHGGGSARRVAIFSTFASLLMIVTLMMLPETRGRSLRAGRRHCGNHVRGADLARRQRSRPSQARSRSGTGRRRTGSSGPALRHGRARLPIPWL